MFSVYVRSFGLSVITINVKTEGNKSNEEDEEDDAICLRMGCITIIDMRNR